MNHKPPNFQRGALDRGPAFPALLPTSGASSPAGAPWVGVGGRDSMAGRLARFKGSTGPGSILYVLRVQTGLGGVDGGRVFVGPSVSMRIPRVDSLSFSLASFFQLSILGGIL